MGSTFEFDLKRFDKEVEIPEELEGIDPELAMELMREHGLIEEEGQSGGQPGGEGSTDNESDNEPDGDEPDASAGSTAPDKEPDADDEGNGPDGEDGHDSEGNDDDQKTVPLAALRDERGKRKKAQTELETLRAEIAQLRNQSQSNAQQQAGQQQQPDPQKQDDARTMRRKLIDSAKAVFARENDNRQPDMLDEADLGEVMLIAGDLKRDYERQLAVQQQQYAERQKHTQSYLQFVQDQKASDDYEDVIVAIEADFEALPADEKQILATAYNRCESGVGTPQDFYLVRKFWNATAEKKRSVKPKADTQEQGKKPVSTQPKKKTVEQKLEEIEKHPKTNLLNGANTQAGPNLAELARKMQDGWDTLTEEEKKILMELE